MSPNEKIALIGVAIVGILCVIVDARAWWNKRSGG
jgi:hypothetical protein